MRHGAETAPNLRGGQGHWLRGEPLERMSLVERWVDGGDVAPWRMQPQLGSARSALTPGSRAARRSF